MLSVAAIWVGKNRRGGNLDMDSLTRNSLIVGRLVNTIDGVDGKKRWNRFFCTRCWRSVFYMWNFVMLKEVDAISSLTLPEYQSIPFPCGAS